MTNSNSNTNSNTVRSNTQENTVNQDFYPVSYHYAQVGEYRVTIAYQRSRDRASIRWGVAFCRATDQFVKRLGRTIADGRMSDDLLQIPASWERHEVHEWLITLASRSRWAPAQFAAAIEKSLVNAA